MSSTRCERFSIASDVATAFYFVLKLHSGGVLNLPVRDFNSGRSLHFFFSSSGVENLIPAIPYPRFTAKVGVNNGPLAVCVM